MAPELYTSEIYNIRQADLYSLAVVTFILVYGCPPFTNSKDDDAHFSLMQANPEDYKIYMRELNPGVSREFEDFILNLLSAKFQNRLNYDEIKQSKWYNLDTATYKEAVTELNSRLMKSQSQKWSGWSRFDRCLYQKI